MNDQSTYTDLNAALKDLEYYKSIQKNLDDQVKGTLHRINERKAEKLILTNKLKELTDKRHELEIKYRDVYMENSRLKSEERKVALRKLIVKKQLNKLEKLTIEQKETKKDDSESSDLVTLKETCEDLLSQVDKNTIEINKKLQN